MEPEKKEEYTPKESNLSQYKVHDCVVVALEYNNRKESWRDNRYKGIVIAIGGDWLSIKQADGSVHDIETTENYVDEKYLIVLSDYSEIEFAQDIDREVAKAKRVLTEAGEKMDQVTEWRHVFNSEVSVMRKLLKWASNVRA